MKIFVISVMVMVNQVLGGLKKEGQIPEDAQPVIVVVTKTKKVSKRPALLD